MNHTKTGFEPIRRILGMATTMAASIALAVAGTTAASADDGRVTSTIGDWVIFTIESAVSVEPISGFTDPATEGIEFTFPAPGTSGPIEYTYPTTGKVHCLVDQQPYPYSGLDWLDESTRQDLGYTCQNVTTVVDPGTGLVGFMAADGPYQSRYLGDESRGKQVDWAQQTFFGVTIPALSQITPVAPTLAPAASCGVEPTVTVPATAGVDYQQHRDGNTITVTAVAAEGRVLAPDAITAWTFDVTPTPCEDTAPEPATPADPALVPAPDCGTEPTVELPTATGVEYMQERAGDMITVTAQATDGYEFTDGAQSTWTFDVSAAECPPASPIVEQPKLDTPSPASSTAENTSSTQSRPVLAQTGIDTLTPTAWFGAFGLLAGGMLLGLRRYRHRTR